jgi:predicted nucleic acid-binding protein
LLVIDTNVLVGVLRRKPPALKWLSSAPNENLVVPGFVVMELVAGCENAQELAEVDELMKNFTVYWPDEKGVARALGYFRSYYRSHGLGLVDALIAACAVSLRVPICTNDLGFKAIPRLKVISPYAPSRK